MPAKKSWDVRSEVKPAAKGAGSRASVRKPRASGAARRASAKSLKARRGQQRAVGLSIGLALVLLVVGGIVYLLWRPEVRIIDVSADGEHASGISQHAKQVISGTYFSVLPRNSLFLYPEHDVRARVLDAYPDISSVSISRSGFTSLSIKTNARVAAFWWCGVPESASPTDATCYESDAEGFIFAPVGDGTVLATSTALSTLRIYGELATASTSDSYPLRAHMKHVESIPNALRFVRALNTLNVPVISIAIHNDEADIITPSGTRITYVLGHEEQATDLARATLASLNVNDGSLQYVDLRFPGKVYLKKKAE